MKINDLIVMSVRNLWRRKLRTFLTVLGVVIGASSILLMLSLGIAMDEGFRKQMESMGSLMVIQVSPMNYSDPKAPKLDDKAIEDFKAIEGVERVIPRLSTSVNLEIGKYRTSWQVTVVGLDAEDMKALGYKVDQGRLIEEQDKNVIVLGSEIPKQFMKKGKTYDWRNPPDPINFVVGTDKVKIDVGEYDSSTGKPSADSSGNVVTAPKTLSATVIGIMPTNNFETAMNVFVPKALFNKISENKTTYTKKLYGENATNSTNKNKYDTVQVKVKNEKQVTAVQEAIKALNFSVFSYVEYLNELKKISNSIQMILGGIGAISLFVAAIGITNTMMMSTYERTKEIGIMKVIGARISDIKKMFLTEALMIGAIGGGIGVLFSYIVSFLMNYFLKDLASGFMGIEGARLSVIPIWLAVAALLFSMLIGLISGYFPARRAMKLSALTAIRTE